MKVEKILLSTIAILMGLIVAGGGFYFYQTTKIIKTEKEEGKKIVIIPTNKSEPTLATGIFLQVDEPKDESVSDNKTIRVSGRTHPEGTIAIITRTTDEVITPSRNGSFATSVVLSGDENIIEILAISPAGEETKVVRTVTYSTESF